MIRDNAAICQGVKSQLHLRGDIQRIRRLDKSQLSPRHTRDELYNGTRLIRLGGWTRPRINSNSTYREDKK